MGKKDLWLSWAPADFRMHRRRQKQIVSYLRFFFICCANGITKRVRDVHLSFSTKSLQKFRAKRIEIGQGIFTSCKRRLKFSELRGAIQDLAIHGKMCIQSSCRHRQCFSWFLGTGANVCTVDKDLIFPPNHNSTNILLLSLALRCFVAVGK